MHTTAQNESAIQRERRLRLRTPRLDDRWHRNFLWRSDVSRTLYRHDGRTWIMFWDGAWRICYDSRENVAAYTLGGVDGEMFVRVAQER